MRRILPYAAPLAALSGMLAILGMSDRSPAADGPHMLAQGMRLGQWLADGRVLDALRQWVGLSTPHPPLGYVPLALVSSLTRDVRTILVVADALWLLLLLDGMVRLARPAPAWMGGVAWLVATATGVVWWSADHAGFDLVAASACVQALAWLQASEDFRDRRASAWTGLWLGLAFLSKYSAPLVLAVPVLACAVPAVRRAPRNVGLAAALWAAIFLPWALAPGSLGPYRPNGIIALEYIQSALTPPDRPGFFPESRTLAQRVSGTGQLEMAVVVLESYGGALTLLLTAGAIAARRTLPMLGIVGGILVLGTMNAREARYALPMVVLLPVAALPRAVPPWQGLAALLGLAVPTWRATSEVFRTCDEACAPARRNMKVTPRWPGQGGTWPWPHPAFLPISTDVRGWQVGAMIDAVARYRVDGRIGLLLEPGPGLDTPTEPAAWQIAIEERRLPWSMETIVLRPGAKDLQEARFLAPFPTPDPRASEGCAAVPGAVGARPLRNASPDAAGRPVRPCETLTLLVTTDEWLSERGADRSISRAWLAAHPHEELARWTLPAGQTALLVRTP